MAFKKGKSMYGILNKKCPRCHGGDLFNKPYQVSESFKMKESCSNCGQQYEMEPGFYWGAMYIAYGLSTTFLLSSFALCFFLLHLSLEQTFTIIIIGVFLLMVPIFRYARSIWVHIFIPYNPNKKADSVMENK